MTSTSTSLLDVPIPHPVVFEPGVPEPERGLSQLAFAGLLAWLDDGVDSQGERYLEMRRRLVSYFDRRGRLGADELADETLNRIARTLEHDGAISTTPQARYCYVVARFVLLEDIRREGVRLRGHESRPDAEAWDNRGATLTVHDDSLEDREDRLVCLDRCLLELDPQQRALIVEYYRDEGGQKIVRRRDLAKRLGITMNALAIRATRIRAAVARRMREDGNPPTLSRTTAASVCEMQITATHRRS